MFGRKRSRGRLSNLVPPESSGRTIFIDDDDFSVEMHQAGPVPLDTSVAGISLPTEAVIGQISSFHLNAGTANEVLGEPLPEGDNNSESNDPSYPARQPAAFELDRKFLNQETLNTLFSLESPRKKSARCIFCSRDADQVASPTYRCQDCFGDNLLCRDHLIREHRWKLPFHRIRRWTGSHFESASLADLGLTLSAGHGGKRCEWEHPEYKHEIRIVDINGVFKYQIYECRCQDAPEFPYQLLQLRLFPATYERPRTAVTFRALENAQLHSFAGKESVWDYYDVIQRETDNVLTQQLESCYVQFKRVYRQWRVLRGVKRSGTTDFAQLGFGDLVVPCPTCPREGINIPENWRENEHARLLYASMMAVDGNFHLGRNNKGGGPTADPPMTGDWAFWAIQEKFDDYISAMEKAPVKEDKSQKCHNFKAGDPSRSGGAKKAGATGVVLVSCARHFIAQANGIADLVKGEVFSRVDVPVAAVIARQDPGQRQVISYDIACKYGVKFRERVSKPYLGGPLLEASEYPKDLEFYVPAWHILGHTPQCNMQFNMRYHPFVGRTAGEGVETIWAVMNAYQYSTREMGHGHRRDTLTDIFNDLNFRKARNEADRICKAYAVACQEYIRKEEELKDLEAGIPEERLKAMERDSEARGTEQFASPESKLPRKAKVLQALRDAEDKEHAEYTDAPAHSEAMFVSNAIDLLDLQYQVRVRSGEISSNPGGDGKRSKLLLTQEQLRRRLVEHFETLFRVAPKLQEANLNQSLPPTVQSLYLPSDFKVEERRAYGLEELAKKEAKLQVANAHHALQEVRNHLGLKRLLIRAKQTHSGQERNQRSEGAIKKAEVVVRRHKSSYQRSHDAIKALKVPVGIDTDAGNLKELLDSDLRSLELYIENPTQPDLPWIWKTLGGVPSGTTHASDVQTAVEDWNQEVIRLAWVHARASRDRWWEERALLREELQRVGRSFMYQVSRWQGIAAQHCEDDRISRGIAAYAMRQGFIYQRLALHATAKFNEAMSVGSVHVAERSHVGIA